MLAAEPQRADGAEALGYRAGIGSGWLYDRVDRVGRDMRFAAGSLGSVDILESTVNHGIHRKGASAWAT
jgi:hypothetical protein